MLGTKRLEKIFHRKEWNQRIKRYTCGALDFIGEKYREEKNDDIRRSFDLKDFSVSTESNGEKFQKKEPVQQLDDDDGETRFSLDDDAVSYGNDKKIKYSKREQSVDSYDPSAVSNAMKISDAISTEALIEVLEKNIDCRFVDRLIYYIKEKALKTATYIRLRRWISGFFLK